MLGYIITAAAAYYYGRQKERDDTAAAVAQDNARRQTATTVHKGYASGPLVAPPAGAAAVMPSGNAPQVSAAFMADHELVIG